MITVGLWNTNRNFPDFVIFKLNSDYKQILYTEKGNFNPFEEKGGA